MKMALAQCHCQFDQEDIPSMRAVSAEHIRFTLTNMLGSSDTWGRAGMWGPREGNVQQKDRPTNGVWWTLRFCSILACSLLVLWQYFQASKELYLLRVWWLGPGKLLTGLPHLNHLYGTSKTGVACSLAKDAF